MGKTSKYYKEATFLQNGKQKQTEWANILKLWKQRKYCACYSHKCGSTPPPTTVIHLKKER